MKLGLGMYPRGRGVLNDDPEPNIGPTDFLFQSEEYILPDPQAADFVFEE